MKRAKKKERNRKFTLSEKQLEKVKKEVTEEAVTKAGLLYLDVLSSEYGWNEDDITRLFENVSRYVGYLDEKMVSLKEVQTIIEKHTGMTIKGKW